MKNWSNDLLNEKIRDDGYLDFKKVDLIRKEHQSGQNHHHKLWNILMFQSWCIIKVCNEKIFNYWRRMHLADDLEVSFKVDKRK